MKVLITGATGFIGPNLVSILQKQGHDVSCLVRNAQAAPAFLLGTHKIEGDLQYPDSLAAAVQDKDYIYHLAASRPPRDINTYYAINYFGTLNLLRACNSFNRSIKKFTYVSSLAAAGPSRSLTPLQEADPPRPVTHYGKSKLLGEKAVLSFQDALPVVILRPPTILGQDNLFLSIIFSCLHKRILPLWKGWTSLCSMDDFIDAMILATESPQSRSQTYYVCDRNAYSWGKIIHLLSDGISRTCFRLPIPRAFFYGGIPPLWLAGRLLQKPFLINKLIELRHPYWLCDPSKIERELKFKCRENIDTLLRSLGQKLIQSRTFTESYQKHEASTHQ